MRTTEDDLLEELERFRMELTVPTSIRRSEVARLLRVIHAEVFAHTLSVARARERAGISDNNASSLFKQEVGVGLRRYIELIRISAAARLLRHDTGFTVFQIAAGVGYASPEVFCRVFYRHYGQSPSRFRTVFHRSSSRSGAMPLDTPASLPPGRVRTVRQMPERPSRPRASR